MKDHALRPPVTCPHYDPLPNARRCRHYLLNGACGRPDEFLCVEWLKANGAQAAPPPAAERERAPVPPTTAASGRGASALSLAHAHVCAGEGGEPPADLASPAGTYAPAWWNVFGKGPPRPSAGKGRAPQLPAAPATLPREPQAPAPLASAEDATALAARCGEVRLESDELGAFWLVAEPTGSGRLELTFRDAAALAAVCAAFPGARVTELRRAKKST